MFKGTFKDVVTNIFAFLMSVFAIIQAVQIVILQWFATVGDKKPTLTDYIALIVSLVTTIVAYFTGKDGNGKAKKV